MRSIYSDCSSTKSSAAYQATPDVPLDRHAPCLHPFDLSDQTNCSVWRDGVARELLNCYPSPPTSNQFDSDGYFDHKTV